MDRRSNKRLAPGGPATPTPNRNAQPCNRTGCSGRINRNQNSRIGSSGKSVCPNPSTGNEITRKPLGSRSVPTIEKKPHHDSKRNVDFPKRNVGGERSKPTSLRSSEKRRSLEGESSSSSREGKTTSPTSSVSTRRPLTVNARRNGSSVRETGKPNRGLIPSGVGGNNSATVTPASSGHEFTHLVDDDDDDDVFHHVDGITEMLITLERFEQDLRLTHEDLVALENTLFLGSLNRYDQHREMRLDIDAMSYEELLALEERMGTVSTALPQQALSKCLIRSVYEVGPSESEIERPVKCCICQEEYVTGDEIGTLSECRHGYHSTCLNRWLQLKNWCPVCKTSAAPSESSSTL